MMTKLIKTSISNWLYGLAVKLNPNLRFDNVVIEYTYPNVIPVKTWELESLEGSSASFISPENFVKFRLSNMLFAKLKPHIEYSTYRINGHNVHEARINIVVFKKK